MTKVFIDAGHGGKDPGAVANGLREKDVTLAVGLKVGKELERHRVKVTYSRKTDKFVSLDNRAKMANDANADCFVSIHTNAFRKSSAKGVETFSFPNSANGKKLAQSIQSNIINKKIYSINRGVKTANFAVLRKTVMPAALTEMAFITNKQDAKLLKTKQNEFAEAIAKGILSYLNIKYVPKKKPTPSKPSGKLYRVQTGAFSKRNNASNLVMKLKNKGYDAIVIKQGSLYKVQTGAFSVRKNADNLVEKLKKDGFEAFVV